MDGETLRSGIFALRTRRIGSVAESMIQRLLKYSRAQSIFHDLYDDELRKRVEVKFSIVQKKHETPITPETVVQCIVDAIAANRMVYFGSWQGQEFDCNLQQVKRSEFDVLYYGLFFADLITIFHIDSEGIRENRSGGKLNYSDKQHKGNVGEGQFHVTNRNLQYHLDNHLYKSITYDELAILLTEVG